MTVDPDQLKIQLYPTPVLRIKASPVEYSPNVREVGVRMIEIMSQADGIGLAAPQVGLSWMMFVARVPADETRSPDASPPSASLEPEVFINPEIVRVKGLPETMAEGCLSLPGVLGEVTRRPTVVIRALDLEGNAFEKTATGLLARCYQHEYDHLMGVMIIDKMAQADLRKNKNFLKHMEKRDR
ncbi:MAG: peptide deformylase [Phycisphaerales bacterium]|jgi:peptide deformylase